jgi:hypothetical protein
VVGFVSVAAAAEDPVPVGRPVPVATEAWFHQRSPAVAADPAGNFLVAWDSSEEDGSASGVFARRYDPSGAPRGTAFLVNTFTPGGQHSPAVAMDAAGRAVVAWAGVGALDGGNGGIYARRYDADGQPLGSDLRVDPSGPGTPLAPAVAAGPSGEFVVAWDGPGTAGTGILARLYDAAGVPRGDAFEVSAATTGARWNPAVAVAAGAGFVIAWREVSWEPEARYRVMARRYDAEGRALDAAFPVSPEAAPWVAPPSVAADARGRFAVAWTASALDDDGDETWPAYARVYDPADPAPAADPVRLDASPRGGQDVAVVAGGPADAFLAVWHGVTSTGGLEILGRAFGGLASGETPFRVHADAASDHTSPRPAASAGGHVVVAWSAAPADRFDGDVLARRLGPGLIFGDGFERGDVGAWDAEAQTAGVLSVCGPAALAGTSLGLQGSVTGSGALFVQDGSPRDEDRYRARFDLHPGTFDPGEAGGAHRARVFVAFAANPDRRLLALVLRRRDGAYGLLARVRRADGTQADLGPLPLSAAPHRIEVEWTRSSAPGIPDGALRLWLDGTLAGEVAAVPTPDAGVEFVRLGALGVKARAGGVLAWDEFDSRRSVWAGPEPSSSRGDRFGPLQELRLR